ncbi:MAG: type II/IV secretion system protein [Chloroflexi bacterium]|nr:type II/IV secretion system protein [Chloroflexota bacterium]
MVNVGSFEDRVARALVQGGFVTEAQLEQARQRGGDLLEALVLLRFIGRESLITALSLQLRVPVVDLKQMEVDPEAVKLLPEQYARQHRVLPVGFATDGSLRVATKSPNDFQLSSQLSSVTGRQVRFALALGEGLEALIDRCYAAGPVARPQPPGEVARLAVTGLPALEAQPATGQMERSLAELPAVQAMELVTLQAVKQKASDIHMVPQPDSARVLFRLDGVLQQRAVLPLTLHESMVSRIKVLAGLDIAEKRRPQDGSFSMQFGERRVDFRVATVGASWGEMMVMRILDRTGRVVSLEEVGLDSTPLQVIRQLLSMPHGLLLVSGPTGSGKTTTLYAAVTELVSSRGNIMTIEDPVEIRMEQLNQIQVNPEAGVDFAAGLKSIMRLDPDVILVGEIRDGETARTAVDAAMTGHLVMGSIHSNDAAAAIVRLIEMGVEPYLVATCVLGTVAQRLVRKICPHCAEPTEPGAMESIVYEQEMEETAGQFSVGKGCNFCDWTGYSGRTGVFEVLAVSPEVRRLIRTGTTGQEIRQRAEAEGLIPLRKAGFLKAKQGITTLSEILRNVSTIE